MIIYEITKDGTTTEIKAPGHIHPPDFLTAVKEQTGIDVNLGDIKQGYERMFFKRNRNYSKPGHTFFKRCAASEFGARPVTFVRIGNG